MCGASKDYAKWKYSKSTLEEKNVKDRFCAFGHDYVYVYSYVLRVQRRKMSPLILHPSCKNHVRHTQEHILFIPELKSGEGFNN